MSEQLLFGAGVFTKGHMCLCTQAWSLIWMNRALIFVHSNKMERKMHWSEFVFYRSVSLPLNLGLGLWPAVHDFLFRPVQVIKMLSDFNNQILYFNSSISLQGLIYQKHIAHLHFCTFTFSILSCTTRAKQMLTIVLILVSHKTFWKLTLHGRHENRVHSVYCVLSLQQLILQFDWRNPIIRLEWSL